MKAKVAVATVSGKVYFLIINELKARNIEFFSIVPGNPVPVEATVAITTEKELHLVNHTRTVVYRDGATPNNVVNEVVKALQGKEAYEAVVIGIDPGEVFGIAVVADGKVNATCNCFSTQEVLNKVENAVKEFDLASTTVSVKIGNGVPAYKMLLEMLDEALPPEVVLEVVSEAGTDRHIGEKKHRRGLRDIVSATRIAGRTGHIYLRGRLNEKDD